MHRLTQQLAPVLTSCMCAAGNCLADLVSNTALARASRLSTAMSAVYAGPLLDLLVAVPLGYGFVLAAQHARHAPSLAAHMPATAVAGAAMLIVHALCTLGIAAAHGWTLPTWFWRWGVAVYAVYMVAIVAMVAAGVE